MKTAIATGIAAGVASWQVVHRTSPIVRAWAPATSVGRMAGPLWVRDSGRGRDDGVIVLLHGLGASSNYFGNVYDGLTERHRVVAVDLLGFGGSIDETRSRFAVDDHVAALDEALDVLVGDAPVTIAAHSMSSAVALTWAHRNPTRTRHVYLWGPPIYRNGNAADSVMKSYGLMSRLFALDTAWAELACRINCANRDLSGRAMALLTPRFPTQVGRDASRHTWEAYHQSLRHLILDFDWTAVLPSGSDLTIYRGADDPIGDPTYIFEIAGDAEVVTVAHADHHVALEHPELLLDAVT